MLTTPTKLEEALDAYETAAKRYLRHPFISTDTDVAAARAEVLRIVGEVAKALAPYARRPCECYENGCANRDAPDLWCDVCRAEAALALVPREG